MVRALRARHTPPQTRITPDYFGMLTCSPASAVITPVIMPAIVLVPVVVPVVVVRMIVRVGSALTGRVSRHSTPGLAGVAAA
jgi:hypothetical protein